MGRYDKIRVRYNNAWVKPREIKVRHAGQWITLGLDDSDNTRSIFVNHNNTRKRVTLNKSIVSIPGESYSGGPFVLYPHGGSNVGYGNCAYTSVTQQSTFFFRATIRKTAGGDLNVFNMHSGGGSYIRCTWLNDGRLRIQAHYSDSSRVFTLETTNAVGLNQWVYLNITQDKGSATLSCNFNGAVTYGSNYQAFNVRNIYHDIGAWGIDFKDWFEVQGAGYLTVNYAGFNISNETWQTDKHSAINHYNTASSRTDWV